jgi:Domain of unknown function (DUF5009)
MSEGIALAPRDASIDALRGLAVLGMVLSGSVAFGDVLPAWMFHAQVPPPQHRFTPTIPGITWVDLVFPFFLFAMGAAMSLARPLTTHRQIWTTAARRALVLLALALFTQHMKTTHLAAAPQTMHHLLSIAAFVLCALPLSARIGALFIPLPVRILAALTAAVLLAVLPFKQGLGFRWTHSDIILVVLANMAFFGTLLHAYTRDRPWHRLAIVVAIGAIWLTGKSGQHPAAWIAGWTPAAWMYRFDFLKYFFILVPGMFVGQWLRAPALAGMHRPAASMAWPLAGIALLMVIGVTHGLYMRSWPTVLVSLVIGSGALLMLCRGAEALTRVVIFGSWLVVVGLLLDPLHGGIKKDPSSFSYWLTTAGLTCWLLVTLIVWTTQAPRSAGWLLQVGMNPLPAYIIGALLITPLLHLTHLFPWWSGLTSNAFAGVMKGLLYTGVAAWLTCSMTRYQWIWRS